LGVSEEYSQVAIPILPNHVRVSCIAADISDRFATAPPAIPAFLIRDHGVFVWAPLVEDAQNYVEILEYVFRYMVLARSVGVEILD
jgi:methylthioribulose-1-phosphate dehydratase